MNAFAFQLLAWYESYEEGSSIYLTFSLHSCVLLPFFLSAHSISRLIPVQRAAGLILDHARLEEISLLLEIDHLAHPRERIGCSRIQRLDADLLAAAVGDVAQI